jgi:hypothetical protein
MPELKEIKKQLPAQEAISSPEVEAEAEVEVVDEEGGGPAPRWVRGGEGRGEVGGNNVKGDVVALETSGSLMYAPQGKTVVAFGVSDLVIVDTPDALLVAARDHVRDLKKVVEALREKGRKTVL